MKTKITKSICLSLTLVTAFAVLFYACKKDKPEPVDQSPVADFTANTTSITVGGTINFTDLSTNTPTSWSWNFGDGDTSTLQNPSHIYATAGTYTVSLTATNAYGSDTKVKTSYIIVTTWVCGDPFTDSRDGQTYQTVQIGTQCWMAENLNIGTMIVGTSDQTNNATLEKYCYNNNDTANCDTYGGLYQWDEMMQYNPSDNGAIGTTQGVCSNGWHIPTDAEWMTMEEALGMCAGAGAGCSGVTGLRGTDQGDQLKIVSDCFGGVKCGVSGFEALLAGNRVPVGLFSNKGSDANFWSSLQSSTSSAWSRSLNSGNALVDRNPINKLNGFSVRCIKD